MSPIQNILYTLVPVVLGGVFNMIFVKMPILNSLKIPIDNGLLFFDGKRIFGENKTWKGFLGMIIGTSFSMVIFQLFTESSKIFLKMSLINFNNQTLTFGFYIGGVLGIAYVLFELPNSFIKRRISIAPGKSGNGIFKYIFLLIDQADSVIGCAFALMLLINISLIDSLNLIILGTIIHYVTNVILYFVKLKSQAA